MRSLVRDVTERRRSSRLESICSKRRRRSICRSSIWSRRPFLSSLPALSKEERTAFEVSSSDIKPWSRPNNSSNRGTSPEKFVSPSSSVHSDLRLSLETRETSRVPDVDPVAPHERRQAEHSSLPTARIFERIAKERIDQRRTNDQPDRLEPNPRSLFSSLSSPLSSSPSFHFQNATLSQLLSSINYLYDRYRLVYQLKQAKADATPKEKLRTIQVGPSPSTHPPSHSLIVSFSFSSDCRNSFCIESTGSIGRSISLPAPFSRRDLNK